MGENNAQSAERIQDCGEIMYGNIVDLYEDVSPAVGIEGR